MCDWFAKVFPHTGDIHDFLLHPFDFPATFIFHRLVIGIGKGKVAHGFAENDAVAAEKAIMADCDMYMESRDYKEYLADLFKQKKAGQEIIDDAVKRILLKKFQLGLFKDPYRYCDTLREKQVW